MAVTKDLVAASATPLVLSILDEADSYGYAIIKRVKDLSGGQMEWTDGMLYPVLHRLEKQKLIESQMRISDSGRQRKYYRIQKDGFKILEIQQRQWETVYSTLRKIWEPKTCLT